MKTPKLLPMNLTSGTEQPFVAYATKGCASWFKKSKRAILWRGILTLPAALALLAATPARADETRSYNSDDTIETSHPDWMRWVPNDKKLSELSLPGTHDTMSLYGGDIAETQSLPLRSQLDAGIRVLDIRARHIEDVFAIHHGVVFQHAYFGGVLKVCHDFLQDNPTETIIMRLGDNGVPDEEDCTRTYEETFKWYRDSTTYGSCIFKTNSTGFTTMPTLGAVRGKVVILRNFSAVEWHGFDYEYTGTLMDVQDEYDLGTVFELPTKWKAVQDYFRFTDGDVSTFTEWDNEVHDSAGQPGRFYLNYTSATSDNGGVYPYTVAGYINPHTLEYLFGRNQTRTTGFVMMDFPGAALISAIIAQNFKYVTNYIANIGDDFDYVFNNLSHSATQSGDDECLDHASQLHTYLEFILPGQYWNVIVSATPGNDHWGYAVSHEGLFKQSDWIDGYSHVAFNARSLNGFITSAQISGYLTTARLQNLSGTAASRAASVKSLLNGHFPGVRWNVVCKRAPGGYGN